MRQQQGKWLFPAGPGHGEVEWTRQPLDGHPHDWSGWAAIWRNGDEICLDCGIDKRELWELERWYKSLKRGEALSP